MMNIGKIGEAIFKQRMSGHGYKITDVSDNPAYWEKDIDFIITSPHTGLEKTFEVKYDTKIHQSGNLYLELKNIHSKNCRGWFDFCQADYLAYGDATNDTFYVIPLLLLKERVNQLPRRIVQCGNDSIGQLVSLKDISDIYQKI